ncbi:MULTISPECIES: hypothetical protein [unclassified Breznakia]|uniref:hypothetical protein n=1 Tax=unclassified Breznakia TaxID=2623764 RepID=UPI0024770BD7|nr:MULTISPECIES: hypothetical protein [unclassified Breznakia]MDH6367984.1 DNA repair exonuclease SbcCD nuclease subunit [Breznakia sp. PH1-1]MDH6405085.1 DNA repair exonuclease SbcCD nuclease subunit [Breznakia sp. PF1-11]MDH6412787.1 DNA repair exonuclease SbcCD nuclease subunit [Breznakia sp. PFB1-11]MDH6415160.1 DNA repair exonuclease SbcCD nuclease subunit [Breznakia sp. PFB1-14]MDH6417471.1 DNA repair exonuclease SbcCD nuclease subunit [Breznakia sp. PFB1-4]
MLDFSSDIILRGDHVSMVKKIQELFENPDYIDIYLVAGAVGVIKNKKSQEISEMNISPITIPRNVLTNSQRNKYIELIFGAVALNEYLYDDEDRAIKVAFEESSETDNKKMERKVLFHQYALGGLEYLYRELIEKYEDSDSAPIIIISEFFDKMRELSSTVKYI